MFDVGLLISRCTLQGIRLLASLLVSEEQTLLEVAMVVEAEVVHSCTETFYTLQLEAQVVKKAVTSLAVK